MTPTLAGVDGCKAGWVAAIRRPGEAVAVEVFARFEALLAALPGDAIIVVDMPIGLPDSIGVDGRGPEKAVRALLGPRKSSVFSIPSRRAVYAETADLTDWSAAHRHASAAARATSDPPRGVSIQAFGIFRKIREIDHLLRLRPELRARVIESHPEAAFWRLNGGHPMSLPKKGGRTPGGLEERRALLERCGLDPVVLGCPAPRGSARDDVLDACAMLLVAGHVADGVALSFPDPPLVDTCGIPIAIRV